MQKECSKNMKQKNQSRSGCIFFIRNDYSKSMTDNLYDGACAYQISIPKSSDAVQFKVNNDQVDSFHVGLNEVNDILKKMNVSLGMKDSMDGGYALPKESACVATNSSSLLYDPLTNCSAWWTMATRYIQDWLKEVWLEKMSHVCNGIVVNVADIDWYSWRAYTTQSTMYTATFSLDAMLKPWIESNASSEKDTFTPVGIEQRKEDAILEVSAFMRTGQGIVESLRLEASSQHQQNPPLANTLLTIADIMIVLLSLQDKQYQYIKNYKNDSRYYCIVAINALVIVQNYLYQQSIVKLESLTQQYSELKTILDGEYKTSFETIEDQRKSFQYLWEQVKTKYDEFLEKNTLQSKDQCAIDAMNVLFSSAKEYDPFGIETIKLMKKYIGHMKKLFYPKTIERNIPYTLPSLETKEEPLAKLLALRTVTLHDLEETNNVASKEMEESSKVATALKKVQLEKCLVSAEKAINNYTDDPSNEHNKWFDTLCLLENNLEKAMEQWAKTISSKERKQSQLVEEIRKHLQILEGATYVRHTQDFNEIVRAKLDKQTTRDKSKEEDCRQIAMEKHVAENRLYECERKLAQYTDCPSIYRKSIQEFKSIVPLIQTSKINLYNLVEFSDAYNDLIHLWNIVYRTSIL